jgi:hypothetical protein
VKDFNDGIAAVQKDLWTSNNWGFIDETGKEITPYMWSKVKDYHNRIAHVMECIENDREIFSYDDDKIIYITPPASTIPPE